MSGGKAECDLSRITTGNHTYMSKMYHHLLITPSHAILVCKHVSDQTCSKGRICLLSHLQTLKKGSSWSNHLWLFALFNRLSFSFFFFFWKCITISLDITVSRRFGRALIIPASGLFLCTVVIMVREVYLSFLRHRHLPSRRKISNATYAFTCCEIVPSTSEQGPAKLLQ